MSNSVEIEADMEGALRKVDQRAIIGGQHALGNQMLGDMNLYVPRRSGTLQSTGHIARNNEVLVWNTPYAKAQFYGSAGPRVFRQYTTPGTGKRWDLVAKGNHMGDWKKAWLKGAGY